MLHHNFRYNCVYACSMSLSYYLNIFFNEINLMLLCTISRVHSLSCVHWLSTYLCWIYHLIYFLILIFKDISKYALNICLITSNRSSCVIFSDSVGNIVSLVLCKINWKLGSIYSLQVTICIQNHRILTWIDKTIYP